MACGPRPLSYPQILGAKAIDPPLGGVTGPELKHTYTPTAIRFVDQNSPSPIPTEMRFPQELVDEILNHLPSDDKQDKRTLRNCSLVAKSWVSPSRRHLFESVLINKANRQLWLDGISPANVELLWHVRSLDCSGTDPQQVIAPPPTHADIGDLYVYLPSFRRLQTITLFHISVAPDLSERMEMFSSCQSVLSSLILCAISLPWRSFIALIDYFPNLRNLELESLSFADDNTNPSPLSRPPRGKLCFHLCQEDYLVAFSDWFAGLDVEYDELVVDVGYVTGRYSQRIVTTCEGSLKRLKFQLRECVALGLTL